MPLKWGVVISGVMKMSKEYPKALYQGSTAIYSTKIAEDSEHEAELREQYYVDFADLPEPETNTTTPQTTDALKKELLDALNAKTELQEQLATAQGEFIAFKNDVAAMKARIAELQGDTTPVGATSDNTNPETIQKGTDDVQGVDFSLWTADQLRDELTKRGIEFKVRDSKADLIALLS